MAMEQKSIRILISLFDSPQTTNQLIYYLKRGEKEYNYSKQGANDYNFMKHGLNDYKYFKQFDENYSYIEHGISKHNYIDKALKELKKKKYILSERVKPYKRGRDPERHRLNPTIETLTYLVNNIHDDEFMPDLMLSEYYKDTFEKVIDHLETKINHKWFIQDLDFLMLVLKYSPTALKATLSDNYLELFASTGECMELKDFCHEDINAIYKLSIMKTLKDIELHLFSWDDIPGSDNVRLIEYLTQKFDVDWVKEAKIEKIDDGKTIKVSAEKNFLYLRQNDEQTNINLEIDDGRIDRFILVTENDKLKIYMESINPEVAYDEIMKSVRLKVKELKIIFAYNQNNHYLTYVFNHFFESDLYNGKILESTSTAFAEDHGKMRDILKECENSAVNSIARL